MGRVVSVAQYTPDQLRSFNFFDLENGHYPRRADPLEIYQALITS